MKGLQERILGYEVRGIAMKKIQSLLIEGI